MYTTFVEDLKYRQKEYNDSFKAEGESRFPKRQREIWAPEGRRQAITQTSFGYDDPNCLRLLAECGYDGQPVASQTASTARKWFDDSHEHIFPPQVDVVRMGLFFNLDFYTLLHWALKADLEAFLVKGDPHYGQDSLLNIAARYNEDDHQAKLQAALSDYRANLKDGGFEKLFDLFEEHWRMASSAGYDRSSFATLVENLFMENLLVYPNHSPKIEIFGEAQTKLMTQVQHGTPQDQDALWRKRGRWQTLLEALDEVYVAIENTRLKNAEIEQAYLRRFGRQLILQTELEMTVRLLGLTLSFILANPDISDEDLAEKIRQTQAEQEKDLADLRLREAQAQANAALQAWTDLGMPMDPEALEKEKENCKQEIRAIRKMVHPDILMNNPVYQDLSEDQKNELHEILLDALKIKPSELGYPPNFAYHDMRSLEGLRQVRKRVEAILKMHHIRIDLQYQIQGETVQEQIRWLTAEITLLENQINAAKGQLTAMLNDETVQRKAELLRNPKKQPVFSARMEERIITLTAERNRLEQQIAALREGSDDVKD